MYPYIRCGKGEFSKPLGVFYSDEWKIEDGNPYVSCKAYDVLYPLQDLTINYGMQESEIEQSDGNKKTVYGPYKCQSVKEIFDRVFMLINAKRREAGIFSDIQYDLQLGDIEEKVIPIVLIEEKSAWDVLQDLANLTCSYIYCDRNGAVIVKCDDFSQPTMTHDDTKMLTSINPSNSFSYSLPVISQTVVNSVNTEYFELELKEQSEYIEIEVKEFTKDSNDKILAKVKLDNLYDSFSVSCKLKDFTIINTSYDSFTIQFTHEEIPNSLKINIDYTNYYKLVKRNNIEQEDTIDKFGLREFNYKAGNLLLNPENEICKSFLNGTSLSMFNFAEISKKILQKYKYGVTFVDAEWTGDYSLTLDSNFCAKSQYDEDGLEEVYECISSEISYDSRFKQKVKGRESQEIIH